MDRNYEAIAIIASAAGTQAAGDPIPWTELPKEAQERAVEAVMSIHRGDDAGADIPGVFAAAACAALDMFDGHGGLAIEEIARLGNFMVNEAGHQPRPGESIVDSAIAALRSPVEASGMPQGQAPAAEDEYLRNEALAKALDARDRAGETACATIARAQAFLDFLTKSTPITRAEIERRGVAEDADGTMLDILHKLGWPTRDNPLGTEPTHRLVEIEEERARSLLDATRLADAGPELAEA